MRNAKRDGALLAKLSSHDSWANHLTLGRHVVQLSLT